MTLHLDGFSRPWAAPPSSDYPRRARPTRGRRRPSPALISNLPTPSLTFERKPRLRILLRELIRSRRSHPEPHSHFSLRGRANAVWGCLGLRGPSWALFPRGSAPGSLQAPVLEREEAEREGTRRRGRGEGVCTAHPTFSSQPGTHSVHRASHFWVVSVPPRWP